MSKVFVGMSGGVDSSVTTLLLKEEGHDVAGVFMRCVGDSTGPSTALGVNCQDRDAEDARRVAEHLKIPFYVWDFEEEYKERVVKYMIDGYRSGITPNPDVMCNREIKFGLFFDRALAMGADCIATGHYVKVKRVEIKNGGLLATRYSLLAAKDSAKDQSYFLWTLTQKQLARCLFPIGEYLKSEVREIARQAGLPTAEKKDSQGICFLGQVKLDDFLRQYIEPKPGPVMVAANDGSRKIIGEHDGSYFYTVGQRHGLDHGTWNMKHEALRQRNRRAFYVSEKDTATNTVVVAEGNDNPELFRRQIGLTDVNFVDPLFADRISDQESKVFARVRYRQPLAKAIIIKHEARNKDGQANIVLSFDEPQKFVAPGQSAVFYSKDGEMLGGGVIL